LGDFIPAAALERRVVYRSDGTVPKLIRTKTPRKTPPDRSPFVVHCSLAVSIQIARIDIPYEQRTMNGEQSKLGR
jgi:hypothetical protein